MKSTTSGGSTIEKLREIFATHGFPVTVVSDNCPTFQHFMNCNGIKHITVSPYHLASNGQEERAVLSAQGGNGETIKTRLSRFLLKYRITSHTITGVALAELLMKRRLRTHLGLVQPRLVENVQDKQFQQKAAHDQHTKEQIFEDGDNVFVRDFRKPKAWLKGVIMKITMGKSCNCCLRRDAQDDDPEVHDYQTPPPGDLPPRDQRGVRLPEEPDRILPVQEQPARRELPAREHRVPQCLQETVRTDKLTFLV
jgi:hypothetical protein